MPTKAKLSVIIPVHNGAATISETVKSIIMQGIKDLEIIIIDDGSTDDTQKVCLSLAREDKRIRVIEKPNGGVSSARNSGLMSANAEYITFVDCDDLIVNDIHFKALYIIEDTGADIVSFKYIKTGINFDKEKNLTSLGDPLAYEYIENNEKIIEHFLTVGFEGSSVCNKIYKSILIKDLRFREDISNNEDKLFLFNSCLAANSICELNSVGYAYRQSLFSATRSGFSKSFFGIEKAADEIVSETGKKHPHMQQEANDLLLRALLELYSYVAPSKYHNKNREMTRLRSRVLQLSPKKLQSMKMLQYYIIKYIPFSFSIIFSIYKKCRGL